MSGKQAAQQATPVGRPPPWWRPHPAAAARLLVASSALLGAACTGSDSNIVQLYPEVIVAPDTVDFGGVVVPYQGVVEVQLLNAGRADLIVSSIGVQSDSTGVFTVSPASATVPADSSVPVVVTFDPATYIDYGTTLQIDSNDPERPQLQVPIIAEGIDGAVPELSVDTLSVDFGEVDIGSSAQGVFTIRNTGTGPLVIDEASGLQESGVFAAISDPAGQTLSAGGSFPVILEYTPTGLDGDWTTFSVITNDPFTPQVEVAVLGNGGGEYPVAVIDAPTDAAPLDTLLLDGRGSYDPNGYEPLTYTWTLFEQPVASTTELSDVTVAAPSVFLDAAGIYTFALEVENSINLRSAVASHTVAAVPSEDLYVLLSWNTANSDVDLHLVQEDPENFYYAPEDCCYCNPHPDWGSSGADDDPLLALDNRVGFGPENINIADPAAGTYYVRVHFFNDFSSGATEATVSIYIGGELQETWSRVIEDDQVWDVASITFPDGIIVAEEADLYNSPYRSCQ